MSAYPPNIQQSETKTTTTLSRPNVNVNYIKSLPGILKIVEIILSFIVFVCSVAGCTHGHSGWAAFVAFSAFVFTAIFFVINLLQVYEVYPQIPFLLVEFVYYVVWSFFYLIAAICLAVLASWAVAYIHAGGTYWYDCRGAAGTGSFFAFVALGVFGFDAFLKFRDWRSKSLNKNNAAAAAPSAGIFP